MLTKILKYSVIGGLPALVHDYYVEKKQEEFEKGTDFKSESDYIREIIVSAREQGLSEISFDVSKDFSDKCSLGADIPIDGINIQAKAKAQNAKNGKIVLTCKFNPDDIFFQLGKLNKLYKEGALSETEFTASKARLIDKI